MLRLLYPLLYVFKNSAREVVSRVLAAKYGSDWWGEFVANVMMSVAQWERRTIGERTSAALAAKKAQGVRLGRPRSTPDAVVGEVVRLRAEGRTIRAIAEELNRRRVPTTRGGSRWWTSSVRGLLRSAELDEEVRTA